MLTDEDIRDMKPGTRIRYAGELPTEFHAEDRSLFPVPPGMTFIATEKLNPTSFGHFRVFLRDDGKGVHLPARSDLEYAEDVVDATPAVPECVCSTRDLMIRGCVCPRLVYERSLAGASS